MFAREISYICDWAKTPRKINSSLNCDYSYPNGTNRHKVELSENQPQKQSENGRSTQRHHWRDKGWAHVAQHEKDRKC